jgi:hypothetical protein
MTTLLIKSLLTSLCQREGKILSLKKGLRGAFPSLAKRGKGRFSGSCKFDFETLYTIGVLGSI